MPSSPPASLRPADTLAGLLRTDSAAPRITTYDDTDSPTRGERIELSARVFSNWVSKAANALQEEFDIAPGSVVTIDVPPHWRTAYWAYAVWSVGGVVCCDRDRSTDLLITDDADRAAESAHEGTPTVLVTLAALARGAATPVTDGVLDEAKELATFPDQFDPWEEPADSDDALISNGEHTAYANLVVPQADSPQRVHLTTDDTATFLRDLLTVWAAGGSVVLSRGGADSETLDERSRVEGATLTSDAR